MAIIRKYKTFSFVLIAVFLLAQVFASAHANTFGDGPHKHDGKVCTITLATKDNIADVAILPPPFTLSYIQQKELFSRPFALKPSLAMSITASARSPPYAINQNT